MKNFLRALDQNGTWTLVPRTSDINVVGSKWMYKTKLRFDGSIERLKAHLVSQGYPQVSGIDFEKLTPIIKPTSTRVICLLLL